MSDPDPSLPYDSKKALIDYITICEPTPLAQPTLAPPSPIRTEMSLQT
jgi:hypothetical protein